MNLAIKRLWPEEWAQFSEAAHSVTFGEFRPGSKDRVDFALLAVDEHDVPIGYVTIKELDAETAYWQFGGSFPSYRATASVWHAYKAAADWNAKHYKRVLTFIENNNTPMLKFAMKLGFRVIGIRNFKSRILLEHLLEFPS